MDCRQIRGLLPAYLDGELSAKTRAEIEEHLASYPECRRIANDYRRDLQVLSYQLRAAPWLPVRQRPWESAGAGGFRSWFGTIGHKVLAGTAMVALAALLVVGALALKEMANGTQPNGNPQATQTNQIAAGSSATSSATVTSTGSSLTDANSPIHLVMQTLAAHNLVTEINKDVTVDGGAHIHLDSLGVDRTISYLTMTAPAEVSISGAEIVLPTGTVVSQIHSGGCDSVGTSKIQYLCVFTGIDTNIKRVTVRLNVGMTNKAGVAATVKDIPVSINLSPIQQANLPRPMSIGQKQHQSDIEVHLGKLTRGVAASTMTWQTFNTQTDKPADIDANEFAISAGGKDVPLITWTMPTSPGSEGIIWFPNLPLGETFRLTFSDYHTISGTPPRSTSRNWAFTVDPARLLAQAQATASAEAQATASAEATPVPTETVAVATPSPTVTATPPEIVATPSTTPSAPASPTLPADLLYLGPSPDGNVALWTQPSDGSDARMIYHPDHDITNFWQVPGSKSVAVQMGNSGPVVLVNLDGTPTGAPTLPDGQAIVEYVPSPDGKFIAYVPADQQSIWIGRAGGEMYQIDQTSGKVPQTIHDLTWAPTSDSFSYHLAQIEGPDQLVVSKPADNGIVWKSKLSVVSSAYSPDGKSVVYSDGNDVYVVDPKTGKQADVTPATLKKGNFALLDVTWRKDGRIGFVAHDDGSAYNRADLWLMQSDGSQAWRAHIDIGAAIAFAWAPSGDGFITEAPAPAAGSDQAPGQSQSYQLYWYPKLGSKPIPLGSVNDLAAQPVKLDWLR